jgi:hypothetical protein
MRVIGILILIISYGIFANPYPDPSRVTSPAIKEQTFFTAKNFSPAKSHEVLRVEVTWSEGEIYKLSGAFLENSGTDALLKSSLKEDKLGSYKAKLVVQTPDRSVVFHSSIGTGKEFRKLVRTLSFRFPYLAGALSYQIILVAEHPDSGKLEKVFEKSLLPESFKRVPPQPVKVTLLKRAIKTPVVKVNFYADGFGAGGEEKFLSAAKKAVSGLDQNIIGAEHFEYRAVFAESNQKLGPAQDLGNSIKIRDSFLGLYFPYWRKFGRWYHVVYPTSETKYRNALAQEPYDYPVALIDDEDYWGVGNYKELTAVPAGSSMFTYLLLHEFGHFMGLNEEYEGGGPTELEFAPKIAEPWSQNITFNVQNLKWKELTEPGISLPTTATDYQRYGGDLKNPVGAYRGGYGDSMPRGKSHKPVMTCMMAIGGKFCRVCQTALSRLIQTDAGE